MNLSLFNIFKIKNVFIRELVESLVSALLMTGLVLLVYFGKIPNPNLITFTGLIIITTIFGFVPGVIALVGTNLYSFYFFSTNNDFIHFTDVNSQKVVVAVITSLICYAFVGILNHLYKKDAKKIIETNKSLLENNEKLAELSQIDALTNAKNRLALRNDFDSYVGNDIQLMLFDIDEFKQINDQSGHNVGDRILSDVSKITKQVFSNDNVYRFGGDEFVVIKTGLSLNEFTEKINQLQNLAKGIAIGENRRGVNLSIGYTYGVVADVIDIRSMIKLADELLYEVKRSGKNGSLGKKYDIDMMIDNIDHN